MYDNCATLCLLCVLVTTSNSFQLSVKAYVEPSVLLCYQVVNRDEFRRGRNSSWIGTYQCYVKLKFEGEIGKKKNDEWESKGRFCKNMGKRNEESTMQEPSEEDV